MDHEKMLKDICELVETDFAMEMECRAFLHPERNEPFTLEESRQMAKVISSVYAIAHGIHCGTCGAKYKLLTNQE